MRILSTGDWHFNAGYDDDVSDSVGQIINYTYKNNVDLVVITGDIYERASDPDSRNLAIACIQGLANKVPVIIVRGNHDAPGDLKLYNEIRSKYEIKVFEAPGFYKPTAIGSASVLIHVMPWLTKARWQSLHPEASKEEGDRTVSQMVLEFLRNNVLLHAGYKHILAGHMTIAGAKAQNRQQLGADGVTLGMYDITEAGFYAAMLGHIHMKQYLNSDLEFYNGSVAALDYGETPHKFFSVLDTETNEVEWQQLNTIHRQDLTAHWTPQGIEFETYNPDTIRGARVRVNLRVEGGDNLAAAREQIAIAMDTLGALEYKVNPQVMPVSKVRAVDISRARSLSDKLKQYWIATGASAYANTEDMLDKLAQLEDECSL